MIALRDQEDQLPPELMTASWHRQSLDGTNDILRRDLTCEPLLVLSNLIVVENSPHSPLQVKVGSVLDIAIIILSLF